jgi:hypothetical protein
MSANLPPTHTADTSSSTSFMFLILSPLVSGSYRNYMEKLSTQLENLHLKNHLSSWKMFFSLWPENWPKELCSQFNWPLSWLNSWLYFLFPSSTVVSTILDPQSYSSIALRRVIPFCVKNKIYRIISQLPFFFCGSSLWLTFSHLHTATTVTNTLFNSG